MKIVKLDKMTVGIVDKEVSIKKEYEILDFFASIRYTENADNVGMIIHKESLGDKFFDLKTKFAGDLLQKFSNYNMSLIVVGDISEYTKQSKSLRDFIRECNRGKLIFFMPNIEDGLKKYQEILVKG